MVTTVSVPTIPSEEYTKFINSVKYNNDIMTPELLQETQNLNWLKDARDVLQKIIRGLNRIKQNNPNSGDLSSLDMYLDESTKKKNLVEYRIRNISDPDNIERGGKRRKKTRKYSKKRKPKHHKRKTMHYKRR